MTHASPAAFPPGLPWFVPVTVDAWSALTGPVVCLTQRVLGLPAIHLAGARRPRNSVSRLMPGLTVSYPAGAHRPHNFASELMPGLPTH